MSCIFEHNLDDYNGNHVVNDVQNLSNCVNLMVNELQHLVIFIINHSLNIINHIFELC